MHICAVGRLRAGPESDLVDDYLNRFNRSGRSLGLGPAEVTEVEDKKGGGRSAEAALLSRLIPEKSFVCALDERGRMQSSPAFATLLADQRDQGCRDMVFIIGGADGLDPSLRSRADHLLSFGQMVWPHMLARVMLSEQLYRAGSILAGSPYHRV